MSLGYLGQLEENVLPSLEERRPQVLRLAIATVDAQTSVAGAVRLLELGCEVAADPALGLHELLAVKGLIHHEHREPTVGERAEVAFELSDVQHCVDVARLFHSALKLA